jgi:nitrogen fixation/metabolism regulation signal transduction histidine kinase
LRNSFEALEQVSNARILISTRLGSDGDAHMIRIVVEDNGPGFPVDSIEQIFDPYVTSKPKGTGLGLAIVKKLVEEHGGRVEATNVEEGGARMTILMPMDDAARTTSSRREVHIADLKGERA